MDLGSAMLSYSEQQFIRALRKDPQRRNMQVRLSYSTLLWSINIGTLILVQKGKLSNWPARYSRTNEIE